MAEIAEDRENAAPKASFGPEQEMDLNQTNHQDIGLKSGQSLAKKMARLGAPLRLKPGSQQHHRRENETIQGDALLAEIRRGARPRRALWTAA